VVRRQRYRCNACGNLTRFDVVTTRRATAFFHYSVGGELSVEEEAVLFESVESVTCRWCGRSSAIEEVAVEPNAREEVRTTAPSCLEGAGTDR
jgi:hypothetical protein